MVASRETMTLMKPHPLRRHFTPLSCRALSLLLFLSGSANLIEAIIPKVQSVADWMEQWVPLDVSQGSRLLILIFGLIQIMVSRGLFRGKKSAWLVAAIAMGTTVLLHLGRAWDWHHSTWSLLLLIVLIWRKRDFTASSDASSSRWGFLIGAGAVVALTVYSYGTVWRFAVQAHLRHDPVVIGRAAVGLVLFQNLAAEGHHSARARRAFEGVQLGSLMVMFGTLVLVLRPVLRRRERVPDNERERIREIMGQHGRDPMDSFALMEDKRLFFHRANGEECIVSYGLWRNYAVALAEPIGPEMLRIEAMNAFQAYCARQDWHAAFYCCHESNRKGWEVAGWQGLQIAEDARIHLRTFELKGADFQGLRTNMNHARKAGWVFRWYQEGPVDHGLEAQMSVVSDAWLASKGGTEMGFDLGSCDIRIIRREGAACVLDAEGRLLAFATWPLYARGSGRVIDVMRTAAGTRGAMDFLILESMSRFKAEGLEEVSLGNAPLARVPKEYESPKAGDRVVKYLFEHLNRVYGYKPLFEFKKKYHPDWQGRYLVFESRAHLPSLAAALVRLHAPKGLLQMLRS